MVWRHHTSWDHVADRATHEFRSAQYRCAMMTSRLRVVLLVAVAAACSSQAPKPATESVAEYLCLWTGSADETRPDILAVLDVTERGDAPYGRLVTTLPVPGRANGPHHTEHEMPADRQPFANGFATGQSFVFDLSDAARPRIVKQFGDVDGYAHRHSVLRLPNGNVLATFQMRHQAGAMTPGGDDRKH